MTERLNRVFELFLESCDLEPDQRESFLDEHCQDDAELRREVEALLENDADTKGQTVAGEVLGGYRDALFSVIQDPEPAMPGAIGSFLIHGVIGRGGMGTVYEAEQSAPQRPVALKVIHPGLATPAMLRRFEMEGELLGRLQHPGIARVFETGTAEVGAGTQPYLAMELIQGRHLREGAPEDLPGRLKILESMARAVEHAHQRGVIHRDLKPANILVTEDGRPVIVDFGIARLVDEQLDRSMRTATGELIGTLPYMSPEQASGQHTADTRTDVYALGVIAYEVLCGELPLNLKGLSIPAAAEAIQSRKPKALGQIKPSLKGDIETVVHQALQKEPDQRYASAGALADDLQRLRLHQPITARPPTRSYELRMLLRRHRVPAALAAIAVLLLIVGTITTTLMMWRAQGAEALAAEKLKAEMLARSETDAVNGFLDGFLGSSTDSLVSRGSKITYVEVMRNAVAALDAAEAGQPDDNFFVPTNKGALARIYHRFSRDFDLLGEHELTIRMARRAWELRKDYLGPGDPVTVQTGMDLIRSTLQNGRDPETAMKLAAEVLPMAEALSRKEHGQQQARAIYGVGEALMYQGQLDAALTMMQRGLRLFLASGEDNEVGAEIRGGLAACQRRLGNLKAGESLLREAIAILERSNGKGALSVTALISNLALNLSNQDRLDEAIPYFEYVIARRKELLGPETTEILANECAFAKTLELDGQLDRAATLLQGNIERHKKYLGEFHRNVGYPTFVMARTLASLGKWKESRQDMDQALRIWRQALPPDHDQLGQALHTAAEISMRLGDLSTAAEELEESEQILLKRFGSKDTRVAEVRLHAALCLSKQGDLSQATERLEEAMGSCEKPDELGATAALIRAQIAMDRDDIKTALQQLDLVMASTRSQDRRLRAEATLLGGQLTAKKDLQAAAKKLRDSYPKLRSEIGGEHWISKEIATELSSWYEQLGQSDEAEAWSKIRDQKSPVTTE